jgi:hypothetical protein
MSEIMRDTFPAMKSDSNIDIETAAFNLLISAYKRCWRHLLQKRSESDIQAHLVGHAFASGNLIHASKQSLVWDDILEELKRAEAKVKFMKGEIQACLQWSVVAPEESTPSQSASAKNPLTHNGVGEGDTGVDYSNPDADIEIWFCSEVERYNRLAFVARSAWLQSECIAMCAILEERKLKRIYGF